MKSDAPTYQQRVAPFMVECFGPQTATNKTERNHRFLEEALELVQSTGCTASEAHQLVDYVFGRPVGEPHQEVGGVMVTLAALCSAVGLTMTEAGEVELQRCWSKIDRIREKHGLKPKFSPVPVREASSGAEAGTTSPCPGDAPGIVLDMVRNIRKRIKESPGGPFGAPFADEGWATIEAALLVRSAGERTTADKVLAAMLEEMGVAEWGTDQHGAEMFVAFINKWCPQMRIAIKDASSAPSSAQRTDGPWRVTGEAWILFFEDKAVPQELFSGHGAEQAARSRYDDAKLNWSCHLFATVEPGTESAIGRTTKE